MIGGYQILDLKGADLTLNGTVQIEGISDFLDEYYTDFGEEYVTKKPILLTNFSYQQTHNNSILTSFERAGTKYTAYIYNKQLEIVNNRLTLKAIA